MERISVFLRYARNPKYREVVNRVIESKEGLAVAGEVLMSISKDEREKAIFRSRRIALADQESNRITAERKMQKVLARAKKAEAEAAKAEAEAAKAKKEEAKAKEEEAKAKEEERKKWQGIVANKDAVLADKDAVLVKQAKIIAELQAQLGIVE